MRKEYNRELLLSLDEKQRQQAYSQLRKAAQSRLKSLRKFGLIEKSIFPELQIKNFEKSYSKTQYLKLVRFLTSKSSTKTGQKEIAKNRRKALKKAGASEDLLDSKDFYDFLNSQLFKTLQNRYDSHQLIEKYEQLFSEKASIEEVEREFKKWRKSKLL